MSADYHELCGFTEVLSHFPFCLGREKTWEDLAVAYVSASVAVEKTLYEYVESCPEDIQKKVLQEIRRKYEPDFESLAQRKRFQQTRMMAVVRQTQQSARFSDPSQAPYWMYLAFGNKTLENAQGCQAIKSCMRRHHMTVPEILRHLDIKYHNDHDLAAPLKTLLERLDEQKGSVSCGRYIQSLEGFIRQESSDTCGCDSHVQLFLEGRSNVLNGELLEDDILSLKASSPSITNATICFGLDMIGTAVAGLRICGPLDSWTNHQSMPTWRESTDAVLIADVVEPFIGIGDENPWVLFFIYFRPQITRRRTATIHIFEFSCLRGIDFQKSLDRIRRIFGMLPCLVTCLSIKSKLELPFGETFQHIWNSYTPLDLIPIV